MAIRLFLLLQAQFSLSEKVINMIFGFLKLYFNVLGRIYAPCTNIAAQLPLKSFMARKCYTGKHLCKVTFQRFPVCKRCGTVWNYDDCIEGHSIRQTAKLCSYTSRFSRGHYLTQECKGILLKTVELASKRKVFYPLMTYCYIDLHTSLQNLLLDKDFVTNCNHWKSRTVQENSLCDIYDGRVWKKFVKYENASFLEEDHSYALMLNLDWFQPYQHLQYSVGAIYLSILNLPSTLRYKLHNICLIGIIPGPNEPEITVNSYIKPLVNDLLQFWNGVELIVQSTTAAKKKVRCAIICCSCDLPAGRKLCGFLGHSAHLGCSKCKKEFVSGQHGLDYSGFNRETWVPRTNEEHRKDVEKLSKCKSKTELAKKESELGCRYSSLLDLPYFDPPTMLVIDPMHNLFLGLAKHFIKKVFLKNAILSENDLKVLQNRINKVMAPSDIGRIPYKIESSFKSFTADQYKNWVNHYSIMCLHGLLSTEHLECWRHLVLACRILCKFILTHNEIVIADALLLQFCCRTEHLFGKDIITPNMYMSCHIKECILDYGPINNFWVFSFERFNGVLGKLPNNNRSIEIQMRRFLSDTNSMRIKLPTDFKEDFEQLFHFNKTSVGTLGQNENKHYNDHEPQNNKNNINDNIELPHNYKRCILSSSEVIELAQHFSLELSSTNYIGSIYYKYSTINIKGKTYRSFISRSKNASIVFICINEETRPAKIHFFAKIAVVVNNVSHFHILAYLSCFKHHPEKEYCGKPVTIWDCDLFEPSQFVPIQSIKCRTVSLIDRFNDVYGNVLYVSPYK